MKYTCQYINGNGGGVLNNSITCSFQHCDNVNASIVKALGVSLHKIFLFSVHVNASMSLAIGH